MTLDEQKEELVSRTCTIGEGTRVTNCIAHMNKSLLERPFDCKLCNTDIKNHLSLALDINKWLNDWKDEAEKLLKTSILSGRT